MLKNIEDPLPGLIIIQLNKRSLVKIIKNMSFRQPVYCLRRIKICENLSQLLIRRRQ